MGGGGFWGEKRKKKRDEGRGKKRKVLVSAAQTDTDPQSPCRVRDCGVVYPGIAVNSDAKPNTQIQRKMPTADQERFTQTFISLSSLPITSKNLTSFSPYNT